MLNEFNGRKLWHYNSQKIERKRYFEPFTTATALAALAAAGGTAGVGAGIYSLFGKKKKQTDDPLAGIRQQLMALSGQVPGLVARQKELTAQRIGEAKEEGTRDIGENVYGERGFGRT